MVAICKRLPTRMTVDEFLVWDADDVTGRRWQLVDGEPVLMAPASAVIVRPPAALELGSIGFDGPVADLYRTAGLAASIG